MSGPKFCTDYADELGWSFTPGFLFTQCCISCHDEAEQDRDYLCEVTAEDGGVEGFVCCWVSEALDEAREVRPASSRST